VPPFWPTYTHPEREFNFGQRLWDKVWCYWEHLEECIGNLRFPVRTLCENIRTLLAEFAKVAGRLCNSIQSAKVVDYAFLQYRRCSLAHSLACKVPFERFSAESAILYLPVLVYGLPLDLYIRNLSQRRHILPSQWQIKRQSVPLECVLSYTALKLLLLAK
jgi:hypothetical protein